MQLHKGHFISDLLRADKKVRWQYKLHRRKMTFGNFYSSTILYVMLKDTVRQMYMKYIPKRVIKYIQPNKQSMKKLCHIYKKSIEKLAKSI